MEWLEKYSGYINIEGMTEEVYHSVKISSKGEKWYRYAYMHTCYLCRLVKAYICMYIVIR